MEHVATAVPPRVPIRAALTQVLVTLIIMATVVMVWMALYAGAQALASTTTDHPTVVMTEEPPYYPGRPF
ncbi:MAG TPA: hypothetical protein VGJ60_26605 [Chloroflexota bacterium]|jgi:hypothetical protein